MSVQTLHGTLRAARHREGVGPLIEDTGARRPGLSQRLRDLARRATASNLGDVGDRLAIERTLVEYCRRCDDGDFASLVRCFTADGSFVLGQRVVQGRADLERWFERAQPPELRGKHLVANALIELQGRDRALVSSDYLFVQMVDGAVTPTVTGRYDDAMVRSGDRWLIDRRVVLAEGAVAR